MKEDNVSTIETDDPRIAKVLGLLDKTTERGCTPEEAEAAFEAAQRLMAKYAIDEALLQASRGGKTEDRIVTDRSVKVSGSYYKELGLLWMYVAQNNGGHMLWSKYGNKATIVITAYESDVKRIMVLGTQLQMQLLREIRACTPTYNMWDDRSKGMQAFIYRRSFADGWVNHINVRLREARKNVVDEAAKVDTTGSLLPALLDRNAAVKKFVDENFRVGKSRGGGRSSYSSAGASAGREAAGRADLGGTRIGGSHKAIGR